MNEATWAGKRSRTIPAIAAACNEEEIALWLDQVPQPYSEKDAREYVASTRRGWREGTASSFAIVDLESQEAVGRRPEWGLISMRRCSSHRTRAGL